MEAVDGARELDLGDVVPVFEQVDVVFDERQRARGKHTVLVRGSLPDAFRPIEEKQALEHVKHCLVVES